MNMKQDMKDLWSEFLKAATRYDDKDETRAVAEVLSRCLGEPLGDPEEVLTEEEQQKKQELVQNFMGCIRSPQDAADSPTKRVVLDFLQTLLDRAERAAADGRTAIDEQVESENSNPQAKQLRELYRRLSVRHEFRPGQLVRWKPGLKYRAYPHYDEPAVVVRVLPQPVYDDETNSDSKYFREPLDVQLAVIRDDSYHLYYYDSSKFEPYK